MRIKKIVISIALIGGFCSYLVMSSAEDANPSDREAAAPILLSQKTKVESTVTTDSEDSDFSEPEIPMPPAPPIGSAVDIDEAEEAVEEFVPDSQSRKVWAIVTAYCPCRRCCGSHANGRTSTGTSAWTRGIAADPNAIPYGTYVYVPGYGYATVDDTGGAMRRVWRTKGMIHIDLRMNYHWQARQWGRKVLKVNVFDVKD